MQAFIEEYNGELDRYKRSGNKASVDDFVNYNKIKWSRDLKLDLRRGNYASFIEARIRRSLYRPFCHRWLFFDRILNEEVYVNPRIFPTAESELENRVIVTSDIAYRSMFPSVLVSKQIVDLHLCASDSHQCFPFYVYDEDGTNRRENITDWALEHFRAHYADKKITKWDIFHYVYGLLHQPEYRAKYAENLKRELPRIPLAPSRRDGGATSDAFRAFAKAGKELARLHIEYETLKPYPLKFVVAGDEGKSGPLAHARGSVRGNQTPGVPLSYRVESKMCLSKDKTALAVNDSLTLSGIPAEAFEYRLGNRSALEWVIDQYQYYEDKKSGIVSDPNRDFNDGGDPEYIVRLVGQVIQVSLDTTRIVKSLPPL